jgi:hypothetical protein
LNRNTNDEFFMIVIHKNSQNQKIDGIIRNGIGSDDSKYVVCAIICEI